MYRTAGHARHSTVCSTRAVCDATCFLRGGCVVRPGCLALASIARRALAQNSFIQPATSRRERRGGGSFLPPTLAAVVAAAGSCPQSLDVPPSTLIQI